MQGVSPLITFAIMALCVVTAIAIWLGARQAPVMAKKAILAVRQTPPLAILVVAALVGVYLCLVFVPPPYMPFPYRYQRHDSPAVLDTWTGRLWRPNGDGPMLPL